MYATLPYIARVEAERRRDAEHKAAHWRLMRSLPSTKPVNKARRWTWQPLRWLSQFRERRIVRSRLREYAAP